MIAQHLTFRNRRTVLQLLLLLASAIVPGLHLHIAQAQIAAPDWPPEWQADSAFFGLWSRTDGPLANGSVSRSWAWGPLPFDVANEAYAESLTGKRLVQYFDKGRMEINDPGTDRSSQVVYWFTRWSRAKRKPATIGSRRWGLPLCPLQGTLPAPALLRTR